MKCNKMSYTTINGVKMVDKTLVDKILEQGQKLRNAMVGSILKNDPFNSEIIYNKHFNTPQTSRTELNEFKTVDNLTSLDEKRLEAFIKGEYMTKDEEKLALDTLRSLSAPALYKTTEKSLSSGRLSSCKCYLCEIYNSNLYCDLRRNVKQNVDVDAQPYPINEVTRDIQDKYRTEYGNKLKYVDSLRVSISSLILNEMGNQKVLSSLNDKKVPYNLSQTYFLEYNVPDCLVNKSTTVSKSKVNSGLENNIVRLCSRRSNDTINFKQVTIHDVKNLDKLNLDGYDLRFKISYRTSKQKTASFLGIAKFNLSSFLLSKNLTCSRGLSVFLNENSPIVVGSLKVSLQLGCGRLYFGQEFIDAINSTKRNYVVLDSDDSSNHLNNIKLIYNNALQRDDNIKETYQSKNNNFSMKNDELLKHSARTKASKCSTDVDIQVGSFPKLSKDMASQTVSKPSSYLSGKREQISSRTDSAEDKHLRPPVDSTELPYSGKKYLGANGMPGQQISENEKRILFGFLYISEAQYLNAPVNTYVTCRPFCQSETSCSKLITNSSNPVFNFSQIVPLIFEDELLHLLRENYMIIEFWQKTDSTDVVIGLTKIFLHQFYLAYRNPVILKYLSKNQLPIIGTDWWEPIYTINTEEVLGHVQVLVALGTEQQINNLKAERGFTDNIVKAKFPYQKPILSKSNVSKTDGTKTTFNSGHPKQDDRQENSELKETKKATIHLTDRAVNTSATPRQNSVPKVNKLDVGIQSDLEMDKKEDKERDKVPTQDMLGSFLNQLMAQRQRNIFVENSTNTDIVQNDVSTSNQTLRQAQANTNVELRKTTDLLDSLHRALSLDGIHTFASNNKKSDTFKATISINSANHLPSRKKCKSKKARNRSLKNEESVLPSCYVTFETTSEEQLKTTPIVPKSTTPIWNYKCDVSLPADLLINNQKRLIFKVWRKSTNAVMQPNMQTDTVLGFAAVDLTILLAGFPNVQGWFNIVDFSGKCNGQINIHITPLENITKYISQKECSCNVATSNIEKKEVQSQEEDNEPTEMLSRTLKRKFSELDEITQRLRLRLSKVTNEDSDGSSDGIVDEFEKDINTLCIEEDFDLINFEEEARKFNISHSKDVLDSGQTSNVNFQGLVAINDKQSCTKDELIQLGDDNKGATSESAGSTSDEPSDTLSVVANTGAAEKELATLDKQLQQGKQRIDTLLEKLSLLSGDTNNPFNSRYVSGCSITGDVAPVNVDTEAILKELDHNSRPNIQSSSGFDPIDFQQLYGGSVYSNSLKSSSLNTPPTTSSNTDTSLITNFSDCRPAPDGQGNVLEEKIVKQ